VIAATRSSPIAQVRNIITPSPSKPVLPAPKKSVPLDKSYSLATEVEAVSYDRQIDDEPTTEPVELPRPPKTSVASPPPPPARDPTEVVVPLPALPMDRPIYKRAPSGLIPAAVRASSNRFVLIGAAVAVVVIVAGAIVLWPSSDVPVSAAPEKTAQLEESAPPPVNEEPVKPKEPVKQEEPVEQKSALDNTMADYHRDEEPKVDAQKPEENVDEKKVEEKKPEEKKVEEKVEEKKIEEEKPAVAQPVAAKIAKRTPKTTAKLATKRAAPKTKTTKTAKKKTTKKETWNPDELFLGD
jgi:hypothetical protein